MSQSNQNMEKVASLCKRRGFVYPSSEIYGGLGSCYDYGPLGVELKNNVKQAWWRSVVHQRDDLVGLDASIMMHPKTWIASGHVESFTDPLVDCKQCKQRFRADQIETTKCPACGGELTDPRKFNLMFKTFMGPVEDEASQIYLRPETAQGIFVNFKNVLDSMRVKLPFGIAQIGKAFRNEITPGNFTFRTREFEQCEIEFFVKPGTDEEWHKHWIEERLNWYISLGISPQRLRIRQHSPDELAHYAKACVDIEYEFPFGWSELEGIANRRDFDLRRHAEFSGRDLSYFDETTQQRFLPFVIEPSAGADRAALAFLIDSYDEEEDRVVLRLHPKLAPIKAAVFPLVRRDGMPEKAQKIEKMLRSLNFTTWYDEKGSIGRRYRRADEIGVPFCMTVDSQSMQDDTVTVRARDNMKQFRVVVPELSYFLMEQLK